VATLLGRDSDADFLATQQSSFEATLEKYHWYDVICLLLSIVFQPFFVVVFDDD
jgi:hypothetical protein